MHIFITKKPFFFVAHSSQVIAHSLKIELILFYVVFLLDRINSATLKLCRGTQDFQDNNLFHHFPEESDEI